ncbi:MAG: M3 family oligoendopeptidase [Planctomycetes bacterium]|nr:M3 family oligoendopeptidase [Planctomycetota bacterium]
MPDALGAEFSLVWDLDALYPRPETPEFRRALDDYRREITALAERSDALPPVSSLPHAVTAWVTFLSDYEQAAARREELQSFVGCYAAADARNKTYQRLEAELSSLEPLRARIATNLEFAIKQADDEELESFVAADERLGRIAFFLRECRRNARLRLPKDQELLAADLAVDGLHAWGRLYDRLSGALRVQVMERGEIVEKSPSQVQLDSPQRTVRENNFYASARAWQTIADTCADALNHIAGTRLTLYRRLGLKDHLEPPLRYNRMRRETLDAMWSAIAARKPMLVNYLHRKAQLLGVEKPAWYDLTAPLPQLARPGSSAELSWDDACRMIVDTFERFSPAFGDFARRALAERWIEAENRPGKRQGGFCTGFPVRRQSRIFMTFTNSADSMSTLAHELGHAWHSHVLSEQPYFLQDYPMNLAETASTFAEAVLGEERLRTTDCEAERMQILDHMLSDAVVFLMNIHTRFLFEDEFHRRRAAGELAAEELSELMLAAQKEAYLGALADDGWNPGFWISKLHFYISGLPFYNFPYTFGYLLSLAVYATAADAGPEFPEQYRRLLIATGCRETEEAVAGAIGGDLSRPDFWTRSLDVIERRVERFLELTG